MKVVTITMNPVLDTSTSAKAVLPLKKTRCKPLYMNLAEEELMFQGH
jgi:fructose-1-phosphate kinase PfkB-like protein